MEDEIVKKRTIASLFAEVKPGKTKHFKGYSTQAVRAEATRQNNVARLVCETKKNEKKFSVSTRLCDECVSVTNLLKPKK